MTAYFEDLQVGTFRELGRATLSEADILAFARQWDPQSFHVDPVAAASSVYRGLIASGIHTLAVYMRLFVDGLLRDCASLGSPGLDDVRWPKPLHPGDTVTASYRVESGRVSASRPGWGIVRGAGTLVDQDGDVVLGLTVVNFVGRRRADGDG